MQNIYLPRCFKKAWNTPVYDTSTRSPVASRRADGLRLWKRLCNEHMPSSCALDVVIATFGFSRDTWYRWRRRLQNSGHRGLESHSRRPQHVRERTWDVHILDRITRLRADPNTCRWGKEKLSVQLLNEGYDPPSVSTIGRMLRHLKQTGALRAPWGISSRKTYTKSIRPHAIRYRKETHKGLIRIQMDVDMYMLTGRRFCHFSAIDTMTRFAWGYAFSTQTARNGKIFLDHVLSSSAFRKGFTMTLFKLTGGANSKASLRRHAKNDRYRS